MIPHIPLHNEVFSKTVHTAALAGALTINGSSIFIHQSSLTASGPITFIGTVGLGGGDGYGAGCFDQKNWSFLGGKKGINKIEKTMRPLG